MPIYLYRCDSCGESHEALQKVGEAPPAECPNCKAQGQMKKLIAPVGIIFKGSGFHKNDYTGGGGGGGKKPESSGGESGGGDKSSDSKPSESKSTDSSSTSTSSDSGSGGSAKSDKVA